jgi:hypothetical protein
MSMSGGMGIRRLAVAHGPGAWTAEARWTSNGLKPYFNGFVVHKGHAFGFDGNILACIDLEDGKRKWKGGRYGNGQLVLLPDQDLLLVISEDGELALVRATPDQFSEVARFPALDAKTWNHPVLVGDVLLVRNGQEMARVPALPRGSLTGISLLGTIGASAPIRLSGRLLSARRSQGFCRHDLNTGSWRGLVDPLILVRENRELAPVESILQRKRIRRAVGIELQSEACGLGGHVR